MKVIATASLFASATALQISEPEAVKLPEVAVATSDTASTVLVNKASVHDDQHNHIAPFGKEDTAQALQASAGETQKTLVDSIENAQVSEIKRVVFRALTRLRAATIKEFDTIARLETQAIDAYNDAHHFRGENPINPLHNDEAPVDTDKLQSFHP